VVPTTEVGDLEAAIGTRSGHDAESSLDGTQQAASPAVIGVFAKDLDPPRNVPGVPRVTVGSQALQQIP